MDAQRALSHSPNAENRELVAAGKRLRERERHVKRYLGSMSSNSATPLARTSERASEAQSLSLRSESEIPSKVGQCSNGRTARGASSGSPFSTPLSRRLASIHGLMPAQTREASSASPPASLSTQLDRESAAIQALRSLSPANASVGEAATTAPLTSPSLPLRPTPRASDAILQQCRTPSPRVPDRFCRPVREAAAATSVAEPSAGTRSASTPQQVKWFSMGPTRHQAVPTPGRRVDAPACRAATPQRPRTPPPSSASARMLCGTDAMGSPVPLFADKALCRAAHEAARGALEDLRRRVLRGDIYFVVRECYTDAVQDKAVLLRLALARIKQLIATTTPFPQGVERRLRPGERWQLRARGEDLRGLRKLQARELAKCLCDIIATHDYLRRVHRAEHYLCVYELYLNVDILLHLASFSAVEAQLQP